MSVTTQTAALARLVPHIKPAGRELELKFLVSDTAFKATQQWPALPQTGARRAVRLRSRYFDTAQGDLHRAGLSLRLRAQRRGQLMTLKFDGAFPGGLFERGEAEVFTHVETPDPFLLGPECAAMIAKAAAEKPLVLAYETDIRRITHRMVTATSDIELAFDTGFIIAGAEKRPVREIELELKSGDPADLYRLGIALAETFPVQLGTQAKSDRGFLLLTGAAPSAVRARPPLAGAPSTDEAIGAVIGDCLAQFTANWPAFFEGDAENAVHQMRVAMRRLRALLGIFGRGFPCPEFDQFRGQAKAIASAMGDARNVDVFLRLLADGPHRAFPEQPGFESIVAECKACRVSAYAQISALLASPETTRFILSLQAFVARHGWRNALPPEALSRLTAPAQDFAANHINRLHQKIVRRGGKALDLAPHQRHNLRIDLKKLRYAADCFGNLFDGAKKIRAYTRAAAALQDSLGNFNDLITATELVGQLEAAQTRAAGIIIGWCGRGAVADDSALLDAWKIFRRSDVFS